MRGHSLVRTICRALLGAGVLTALCLAPASPGNNSSLSASTATSFSDSGLAPSTTYFYTVAAYDAAGNTSAQSASASAATLVASSGMPALPRVLLDTAYAPPTGGTVRIINAGGDLQAALNAAQLGDVITLEAGATFTGNYTLPNKSGSGWIIIRTSAPDASLPPPGTRITPAYASALPKVVSPNSAAAIATLAGAHHYRLIGLEVTIGAGVTSNTGTGGLVQLGDWPAQTTLGQVPHDIILDRVYVHGSPAVPLVRCIALNSASTAVIDSYISDAHHQTFDAQAIAGFNGPGPFKIVNNYLEGPARTLCSAARTRRS